MTKNKYPLEDLSVLESSILYHFQNMDLLYCALTHRSYANESEVPILCNERLEFLGDMVLGLSITDLLYKKFIEFDEGELSNLRAFLIRKETLAEMARTLNLSPYMFLGKGELSSGGQKRDSLLSDTLEAILGAIYLDGGLSQVEPLIHHLFLPILNSFSKDQSFKEYKNILQEYTQAQFQCAPNYEIISAIGPEHSKWFEVVVTVKNDIQGRGQGPSKKEAEKNAAKEACEKLQILDSLTQNLT